MYLKPCTYQTRVPQNSYPVCTEHSRRLRYTESSVLQLLNTLPSRLALLFLCFLAYHTAGMTISKLGEVFLPREQRPYVNQLYK